MNRSISSTLVVLAFFLCLGCVQLVAAQFEEFICDTGPDAFAPFGIDVPQTCIDVPSEDGLIERCFYTYIPESCSTKDITKAPLVVDSHGQGSCAFWSAGYTGWQQKAQEECLVVVWPQGGSSMMAGNCFDVPGFLPSSEVPGAEDTDLSTVSDLRQLPKQKEWTNPPMTEILLEKLTPFSFFVQPK